MSLPLTLLLAGLLQTGPVASEPAGRSVAHEGFAPHVRQAIESNEQRRRYYARVSGGESELVSGRLIRVEWALLPLAAWFDWRASAWNEKGIGLIRDDFVPMDGTLPPETPPRYRQVASQDDIRRLDGLLLEYQQASRRALEHRDFLQVADLSASLVDRLEHLEATTQAHFAMTRHLVESLGLTALNAMTYHQQSGGEVDGLAADFLWIQTLPLRDGLTLDVQAQPLQRRGIGILVNDLPPIPFHETYARLKRASNSP